MGIARVLKFGAVGAAALLIGLTGAPGQAGAADGRFVAGAVIGAIVGGSVAAAAARDRRGGVVILRDDRQRGPVHDQWRGGGRHVHGDWRWRDAPRRGHGHLSGGPPRGFSHGQRDWRGGPPRGFGHGPRGWGGGYRDRDRDHALRFRHGLRQGFHSR